MYNKTIQDKKEISEKAFNKRRCKTGYYPAANPNVLQTLKQA